MRDGRQAYAADDPERAAGLLAEALALWHGRPLADVPPTPLTEAEAGRLAELRLDATELRITGRARLRPAAQVIPELRGCAGRPSAPGRPVAAADAGAGRRGPPRRGARRLRAGARRDRRRARRGSRRRAAPVPRRPCWPRTPPRPGQRGAAPGSITAGTLPPGRGTPGHGTPGPERRQEPGPDRGRQRPARAAVPAQLPADMADFTGREDQVKHLCDLLSGGRRRAATPGRSASRWWPAPAGWARPRWPCTPRTASGPASPTASCTSTCWARPRSRCGPRTCWPGSCATSASTAGTYRPTRPSARPATGPSWPAAGCWSCWTTPATPLRSGRCCRAPHHARC